MECLTKIGFDREESEPSNVNLCPILYFLIPQRLKYKCNISGSWFRGLGLQYLCLRIRWEETVSYLSVLRFLQDSARELPDPRVAPRRPHHFGEVRSSAQRRGSPTRRRPRLSSLDFKFMIRWGGWHFLAYLPVRDQQILNLKISNLKIRVKSDKKYSPPHTPEKTCQAKASYTVFHSWRVSKA